LAVQTLAGFGNFDQVFCDMIEVQHPIDGHLPVSQQRLDPVPDPGGAIGQEHHLFGSMHLQFVQVEAQQSKQGLGILEGAVDEEGKCPRDRPKRAFDLVKDFGTSKSP